jgi:23S rRNA pseudouridine2604 synthase
MAERPRKTLGRLPATPLSDAAVGSGRSAVSDRLTRDKPVVAPASGNSRPSLKVGAAPPWRQTAAPSFPATMAPTPHAGTPAKAADPASGAAPGGVRISKLMAERGLCSRRDADEYIARGWVFVDGRRVSELGTRADPAAVIVLDRKAQANQQSRMTILLHKPVGYVSGQPEPGFTPAVTLIQPDTQYRTPDAPVFHPSCLKGLAPAGRLDIDSAGLLVLTQDGRVARQLVGENSTIDKEYLVRVEGHLDARGLALLNHGLSLDDRELKPAKVEWLNDDQLRFVLREGRKRQIRRMCDLVGLRVTGLKRVRIGAVRLGDLPLGQWRFLRPDEAF